MNKFLLSSAALALTATGALAGGLDRSGQGIGLIFEDGDVAEISYGHVMPSVTGTALAFTPGAASGNVAPSYSQLGFGIKADVNDTVSFALIFDQPFGANVEYAEAGYILDGSTAEVTSTSLTALARYKINENFSVHGGLRTLSAEGSVNLVFPAAFASTYSKDSGTGYVLGGAYERPDIALRVALTYSSAIDLELAGSLGVNSLTTTMPQSVNLDFQTGIAANTLLFGSVRWADWSETALTDNLAGDLVNYTEDAITYSVGVGRKFSETFSGAVTIGFEAAQGGTASNLSPTDGSLSLGLGGTYKFADNMKVTGGVRYVSVGDANTGIADFKDNSALGLGLKVSYSF